MELNINAPQNIEDVSVGMEVTSRFIFTQEDINRFSELVDDQAPIHFDDTFASTQGYSKRIVFGLFVTARFSGILGMQLPGPHTVMHNIRVDMVKPVYVDETIEYVVKVRRISPSVGAVILDLGAFRLNGELVTRGSAQCGFIKRLA